MKRTAAVLAALACALASGRAEAADPPTIRMGWSVPAQTQHYVMMKKPAVLKQNSRRWIISLSPLDRNG